MPPLNNETVLVTGASSGIGLELARCFAADGSRLVLVARNTAALETLAEELRRDFKIDVLVRAADLAQPETPDRLSVDLEKAGVTVDVLVNNAGFGSHGAFKETSLQRQLEMLQVNITSLTHLTGLFLPGMIERRRGGVLNVGSVAGFQPGPLMAIYYATKAFVLSFTEAIAEEVAGSGVVVSALCPGPTHTNFGKVANFRGSDSVVRHSMTARAVAICGHRGFRSGRVVVIPGFINKLGTFFVRLTPRIMVRKAVKGLISVRKPANQ